MDNLLPNIFSGFALVISFIALLKAFYSDSDTEAKIKGRKICEVEYHKINQQGYSESFIMGKDFDNIDFYLYRNFLIIKSGTSNVQIIIKLENIDKIKFD